jgi:long-chain fatty acid transport protein
MLLSGFCASATAGGLESVPVQARAASLGSAVVALQSDAGDFARNPALIHSSGGTRLTLGASLIIPEYRFEGIAPSQQETKAEPIFLFPPSFALSVDVGDKFSVGLSAGAPFLARAEWDAAWAGRQLVTSFEHRTGVLIPGVSYSPFEGASVGIGLPLRLTKHVMTSWIVEAGVGPAPGPASQKTIEGESPIRAGFQAGLLLARGIWSVGGAYTTGWAETISDAEASRGPQDPASSGTAYTRLPASIALRLPAELSLGATVRPFPSLLLTGELDLEFWSTSDGIRYEIPGTSDGYVIPQNWKDTFRLSFGVEYRLAVVDVRGGFSYDASPVPDVTAHPAFPESDRFAYSAGLGYRVGPGLLLDLGITAFAFKDRKVVDSDHLVVNETTGAPGQAFNGTYRSSITSIAFSVSYLWR